MTNTNPPGIVDRATLKQIYQTLTKNEVPLDKNGDTINFNPPNHQPSDLYAPAPCPACQTKQARIDALSTLPAPPSRPIILFSARQRIVIRVFNWYASHPHVPPCTFNTVTALYQLGLLIHPDDAVATTKPESEPDSTETVQVQP